ncbi:MAG: penicillin-binding protein 2 [Hyphomicrobiales bacterium]|nr:penicillin-binding protein 2 [Hyphomicrobiales bacterium]MCP5371206.1 penicillin-binding protein 2 [Hyphomicrobiales bacterium]
MSGRVATLAQVSARLRARAPIRLEGNRKQALETSRNRLLVAGAVFCLAFAGIALRLVDLGLIEHRPASLVAGAPAAAEDADVPGAFPVRRADVVDRNGVLLATSLPVASLYADPAEVLDPAEVADKLSRALPDLGRAEVLEKLRGGARFVWLHRNLTPLQQQAVIDLGLPGLAFRAGEQRVYPQGRLAAHVVGLTDIDGRGIAGIEQFFQETLTGDRAPLVLSLDMRVQTILHQELAAARHTFRAAGAAGLVLDARSGEVLAMVSLPDYDPNRPDGVLGERGFNRAAKGVYEMGSTFKLFTAAMALDSGRVKLDGGYDASKPIRVARFTITDYHPENRWLSVPEILIHSSNIGAAKMAMDVGGRTQQKYLERLGILRQAAVELPEVGVPLVPEVWRDVTTMTISYGHGIAVSPLQLAAAATALVNGGVARAPTLLRQDRPRADGHRVFSADTSRKMRGLMRLVVQRGTGKNAAVDGYDVGGKTGTAEKIVDGRYRRDARVSSFLGSFPMSDPRYVVLAVLDEPKGTKQTLNYATGGWVAAPVVGNVVRRIAPMLGLPPAGDAATRLARLRSHRDERAAEAAAEGRRTALRGQRVAVN